MIQFFLFTLLLISLAEGATLDQLWQNGLRERELAPQRQSYCYINREGKIIGQNINYPLPIGSISKIFTSLMALDHYGVDHRFKTTVMYQPESQWIHLVGNKDPLMAKRQLWYILAQLNKMGIKSIQKLSFDENFIFFPNLFEATTYEHRELQSNQTIIGPIKLNPDSLKQQIKNYVLTTSFSPALLQEYKMLKQDFPDSYPEKINFTTREIYFHSAATFNQGSSNGWVNLMEFNSSPLVDILKYINSYSNNAAADLLYQGLNGSADELYYLLKKLNIIQNDAQKPDFFTGSGIPLTIIKTGSSTRYVNRASCQLVALTMAKIHRLLNHYYDHSSQQLFPIPWQGELLSTPKIMPVNGKEGTLRSYSQLPQTFIGKTGTLRLNKTLALSQNTFSGVRHAVFLGQSNNSAERIFLTQLYQQMLYQMSLRFDGAKKIPIDHYFQYQIFITNSSLP